MPIGCKIPPDRIVTGFRIRLIPTKKQRKLFEEYFSLHRYCYNVAMSLQLDRKINYDNGVSATRFLSRLELSDHLTKMRHSSDTAWLANYDCTAEREAMFLTTDIIKQTFNEGRDFPYNFMRKKSNGYKSFCTRPDRMKLFRRAVQLTGIGIVRTEKHPYYNANIVIKDTHVVCDLGEYWVTGGYLVNKPTCNRYHKHGPIGIDFGIKHDNWFVDSNYNEIHRPNTRRIDKRIERLNRELGRKQRTNNRRLFPDESQAGGNVLDSLTSSREPTKRETKLRQRISKLTRHRINVSKDVMFKYVSDLMKYDPSAIVIEDLSAMEMIGYNQIHSDCVSERKHIHNSIVSSMPYTFKQHLSHQAKKHGIPLIKADSEYPSTQLCSCCGNRLTGDDRLKLADREYICPACGMTIDRDLNSSFNLKYLGWSFLNSPEFPDSHSEFVNSYSVVQ